ncbi:transcription termination/antitermination protein NusA [Mycoplasmopsis alligatoris]|uniref:Putative transcription termination factor NusA n=1 Tax=Mycoplasmopsis alligatoris A21JP2 TaxID=747682 RepID=D4XWG2_9BACT|nr:transcription termination/antitermination protein NusA [Mycoplasmopsis alligatoris]EFF41179.1 putative transcription termination factor NusA [Mycoplasmopsis alligatoris A21JP2]
MKKETQNQVSTIPNNNKWFIISKGYALKNNLTAQQVADMIADETTKAINRDIDPEAIITFTVDESSESVFIKNTNAVVVEDDFEFSGETDVQHISFVPYSKAKKVNKEVHVDDIIEWEIDFEIVTEKCKTAIRNGFIQQLKANEKAEIFKKYHQLIGTKIKAKILSRNKDGSYNLAFEDGVTAFLPFSNINTRIELKHGVLIDVYIETVSEENKLSQVQVSTDSPQMVYDLLKNEVPEIAQGLVEIMNIQRAPGIRSKIAVRKTSVESEVDPISSVIGVNGSRINEISRKLGGEKIDVILYSEEITEYIKNALSPARIVDVVKNKAMDNYYYAIVNSETDMYVAMGKGVVNVNLAKKISGCRIELIKAAEAVEKGLEFNKAKFYDKPLIGRGNVKTFVKKSRPSNYFDGIDINLSDFAKDVSMFMETQKEINEVKESIKEANKLAAKQAIRNKKSSTVVEQKSPDFDSMFDEEMSGFDDSTDTYDFIKDIDSNDIFDDNDENEFIEEVDEESNETEVTQKDESVKAKYKKAKVDLKDFKVDSDLTNYGLDSNLDLSGFDDEWEK